MPNSPSISEEASASSETRGQDYHHLSSLFSTAIPPLAPQPKAKKKRSQPGNPDPDAEVIALSPKSLMATNRFVCEICNKGFQRDQNLQLHRRGHNLPWKLRQRSSKDVVRKRVYVCPEASCVHHHPSRALGDLTGIKKHFSRKHGEKKWKCERCSKRYAVHSDWKAHVKACGSREYRCDCGTLFSRKDSFITHRAFCDALAEESARLVASTTTPPFLPFSSSFEWDPLSNPNLNPNPNPISIFDVKPENLSSHPHFHPPATSPHLSATALLQKASTMGPMMNRHVATAAGNTGGSELDAGDLATWPKGERLTRDFLGIAGGEELMSLACLGMDLVTFSPGDRGGDRTKSLDAFGLPPVSETWGG